MIDLDYYPAFSFQKQLPEQQARRLISVAQKYDLELRYWHSNRSHLYVFKVPDSLDGVGDNVFREVEDLQLDSFKHSHVSDYEWDVYSEEVLYWQTGRKSLSHLNM